MKFRQPYDEDAIAIARRNTAIANNGPRITQTSFKDDTDINVIMKRFGVTDGAIATPVPDLNTVPQNFGEPLELRTVLDMQRAAKNHFDSLPADLRKRFRNDPRNLWDFVNDPDNHDEAVKIGLLKKTTPPEKEAPPKTPEKPGVT